MEEIDDLLFDDFQQMKSNNVLDLALEQNSPQFCKWEICQLPEFPNIDVLVDHVNSQHLDDDWSCQWQDCSRKGVALTSRASLVSHMRSHTGEKPFYCVVPECLKCFSRSDALIKHLKTLHGIDATSIQEAYDIIEASIQKEMENFKTVNESSPNDELKSDTIFKNFTEQLESEHWGRYDILIDAYHQLKNMGIKQDIINSKIDYIHQISSIRLNPAMSRGILKSTKQALELHDESLKSIESNGVISNVAQLDINSMSIEELNSNIQIMESYNEKLESLSSILDERLLMDTKKVRLEWFKKELVLNSIQSSDSSLENLTTSIGV